jgi:diaminohydroxyphosphoribosylaminopyrimidine deaminase / 5-amino-6-(5-phosphoribosylamino)uracil reductase
MSLDEGHIYKELIFRSVLTMGRTAPNPPVACVIETPEGRIFSGGTEIAGKRHAEIVALDCFDKAMNESGQSPGTQAIRIFVTLEPCSTHGRTAPCTSRIIRYKKTQGLEAAAADPSLSGTGIRILKENFPEKNIGLSQTQEFKDIAEGFLTGFMQRITGIGPRFHIKAAVTKDGFIGHKVRRIHISGPAALEFGLDLRSKMDAVLVGPGTTAADLPGLDFRPENYRNTEIFQEYTKHHKNIDYTEYLENYRKTEYQENTDDILNKENRDINLQSSDCFCASAINSQSQSEEFASGHTDIFLESVFKYKKDIRRISAAENSVYQPRRIFLLGRLFPHLEEFLLKQKGIEERTGVKADYLLLEKNHTDWEKYLGKDQYPVIADLAHKDFPGILRRQLGAMGINEVLIEGGSILYESLRPGLLETDRFYLLQSTKVSLENVEGRLVKLPDFIKRMKKVCQYDLADDILYYYKYG